MKVPVVHIRLITRSIAIGVICLGLAWTWISRPSKATEDTAANLAPRIGALAPDINLATPDGKLLRLNDFRGSVIILNFWATWCPPCKAEMPALEEVHVSYRSRGVVVLAVNQMESPTVTTAYAAEHGLSLRIALDSKGYASRDYRIAALPTTYFIDQKGVVRDVVYGGPMPRALIESKVIPLLEP